MILKGKVGFPMGMTFRRVQPLLVHVIHRKLFNHDGATRKKSTTAFLSFRPQEEI
jgi:hypothetical protein